MSNTLANEAHQRSLKDFLSLYNTITEYCFNKCVSNFNERSASSNETVCVDVCTDNYVQYNQRFMFNFVDHQERRKKDTERLAVEAATKEAAAAQAAAATEQQTPSLEGQPQFDSSGSNSTSATDDNIAPQGSLLTEETLTRDSASSSDSYGAVHHASSVNS